MSSILKALKKVENDRASNKPKTLPPSSKIETTGSQTTSSAKIMITGLLLFVLGAGSVYYLTNPSQKADDRAQTSVSTQKNEPAKRSGSDETEKKDTKPALTPQLQQTAKPDSDKKLLAVKPATKPAPATKPDITNNSVAIKQQAQIKPTATPSPSTVEQPARQAAVLEVNGIAYQGENGDSIAVINGVSVSKNSVIEGFTVQNIHQDRVTFSKSGKNFDVELGKTNR